MAYDIFISYKRRPISKATAPRLYDFFVNKGYNVFFDKKEMRSGNFNTQIYEHIENATDILILIEQTSLDSCYSNIEESYKEDWFCKEIMHALKCPGLNIIPLILDGCETPDPTKLPKELKELTDKNFFNLEPENIEKLYNNELKGKNLKSKPTNLARIRKQRDSEETIGSFLFYNVEDANFDIYEFGEFVVNITKDMDEEHPFIYPVSLAGEHRFRLRNNYTGQEQYISKTIKNNTQEWIPILWEESINIWQLTERDINSEIDRNILYFWGKVLFYGTRANKANLNLAYQALGRAEYLNNKDARKFLQKAYFSLIDRKASKEDIIKWLIKASEVGNIDACYSIGRLYEEGLNGLEKNETKAKEYYEDGASKNEPRSQYRLVQAYKNGELGLQKNTQKAIEILEKCADNTHYAVAQFELSKHYDNIYDEGKKEEALFKSLYYLNKAAYNRNEKAIEIKDDIINHKSSSLMSEEKHRLSRQLLAEVYSSLAQHEENKEDNRDSEREKYWTLEAANLGHTESEYKYAECIKKTDIDEAAKWYKKAAEKNHSDAIDKLIHICERNYASSIDKTEYGRLLRGFANNPELDINKAKYYLGIKYIWGNKDMDIEKDEEKGFNLLTDAITSNTPGVSIEERAYAMLTLCYIMGWGCKWSLTKTGKYLFYSIKSHLLFVALFELIEYIVENGIYKMAGLYNYLSKHTKTRRLAMKVVRKSEKWFDHTGTDSGLFLYKLNDITESKK